MKLKYLIWLGAISILWACDKKEDYTFTDEQLVTIIADLHFADNTAQFAVLEKRDSLAELFFQQVL